MVLQNVLVGIFFYFLDVENGDKRQTWPKKMALNELCLWWKILVQNIVFFTCALQCRHSARFKWYPARLP